jgi:hypothetical protein
MKPGILLKTKVVNILERGRNAKMLRRPDEVVTPLPKLDALLVSAEQLGPSLSDPSSPCN